MLTYNEALSRWSKLVSDPLQQLMNFLNEARKNQQTPLINLNSDRWKALGPTVKATDRMEQKLVKSFGVLCSARPTSSSTMGKKQKTAIRKPKHQQLNKRSQKDQKVQILQVALAEAIDENQVLRKRVAELQALLVATQMRFEELTDREEHKDSRHTLQFQKIDLKSNKMSKS